jgi:hypothetical protein
MKSTGIFSVLVAVLIRVAPSSSFVGQPTLSSSRLSLKQQPSVSPAGLPLKKQQSQQQNKVTYHRTILTSTNDSSTQEEEDNVVSIPTPSTTSSSSIKLKLNTIVSKLSKDDKSILSAGLLVLLDITFRRVFRTLQIQFPSSLGGCCILFGTLLATTRRGDGTNRLYQILSPGAGLLAKWLPVFFVPSLVTLPLVGNVGTPIEVSRK